MRNIATDPIQDLCHGTLSRKPYRKSYLPSVCAWEDATRYDLVVSCRTTVCCERISSGVAARAGALA